MFEFLDYDLKKFMDKHSPIHPDAIKVFTAIILLVLSCHSAPLEMPFPMIVLRFGEIEIEGFWPKTMDYSQAFLPYSTTDMYNNCYSYAIKVYIFTYCSRVLVL